jgi:hypothetical protein
MKKYFQYLKNKLKFKLKELLGMTTLLPLVSSGEKLEAINYVLNASGDLPVDSMDDLSPEAQDVEKYIDRAILIERWLLSRQKDGTSIRTTSRRLL